MFMLSSFRRSLFNKMRLKTRVFLFLIFIVFVSLTLLYRALMSHDVSRSKSLLFPTMEKRPVRFQSKYVAKFDHHNNAQQQEGEEILGPIPGHVVFQNSEFVYLKDRDLLNANSREAMSNFLATLYPTNWKQAAETDEVAFELKYLLLDYGFESKMSCKEIDSLRLGNSLSSSRSKFIEYGHVDSESGNDYNNNNLYDGYNNYNNRIPRRNGMKSSDMVVKSPSSDQETKIACMKQIYDPDYCGAMGNYRFLREVLLMSTLRHPNIMSLKGYCLRGSSTKSRLQSKGLILVTDVGTPITPSMIQVSSRTRRLSMALQVSQLLLFLERSPLGCLKFTKVQLKDFVLVKEKVVQLSDFDDLEVGEKKCSYDNDCVHENSGKGVSCTSGLCEGFNSLSNLDLVAKAVLIPLLHPPDSKETSALYEKLQKTELSTSDLASALQTLYSKAPADYDPPRIRRRFDAAPVAQGRNVDRWAIDKGDDSQSNHAVPEPKEPSLIIDDILTKFIRFNGKNFAGIYDYHCAGSRVTWGCVFTVTSLKQAATLCYKDTACQSFVVFTTLPETETLMTVVMKNATNPDPSTSSGTTLFIKLLVGGDDGGNSNGNQRPALDQPGGRFHQGKDEEEAEDEEEEEEDEEKDVNISSALQECLDKNLQNYESARFSREKRMMAHLGLKGIREQSWRISAFNQDLGIFTNIVRAEGGGGRLLTELVKRRPEDVEGVAPKATFMAEDGPKGYHVAYAWIYHMDRILGFYHTPPCVGKTLSSSTVEKLHTSFSWEETFRPLIQSDGTLSGILIAPIPKVMSISKLILSPLKEMVSDVVPFERPQKLQLEYVMLWWLGGMNKADNEYLGYKGHLIHFHADKSSFVNTSVNLSDYLNHCQFPNVAYKALMCFRCKQDKIGTSICHFAEEAANRVQAMFEDEVEMDFHERSESQLSAFINQVASSIMLKVDNCIKKFGRENVLY